MPPPRTTQNRVNITLYQCQKCGYIFNSSFDFSKVSKAYESKEYLSRKIVSKAMSATLTTIRNKILAHTKNDDVFLEIAPGSGDLAFSLVSESKHFYTIDPSEVSNEVKSLENLTHIQGFFDYKTFKNHQKHPINFIIFRHLLEHIPRPRKFLEDVVSILENEGKIYIEVPNILEFFSHLRFYEIFNDHCGYYQKETLIQVMKSLGCEFIDELFLYDKQHMGLIFKKNHIQLYDSKIQKAFLQKVQDLNAMCENYNKIAIYGAGAHGNTLITFLNNTIFNKICVCFDLDLRKQGKFLQDSHIKITAPIQENLNNLDCIIIAAPLYEEEITKSLIKLGFKKDIILTKKGIKLNT